jgi:5,6,7,8-tetrahydromethanopterin hydro-lyase
MNSNFPLKIITFLSKNTRCWIVAGWTDKQVLANWPSSLYSHLLLGKRVFCSGVRLPEIQRGYPPMSMFIGEALVGDGNEIAHIDLLIGSKNGPVGVAFANALANQSAGHSSLLAVVAPNLLCKPATVMITKVTIKGMKQAVQMFGPAQAAVARAVADSAAEGIIPSNQAEELVVVCGVFIHPAAADDNKIFQYNYDATKLAIARAMKNEPAVTEVTATKATVKHPYSPK